MYYDYSSATLYLISIMSYVLRKEGNGYALNEGQPYETLGVYKDVNQVLRFYKGI